MTNAKMVIGRKYKLSRPRQVPYGSLYKVKKPNGRIYFRWEVRRKGHKPRASEVAILEDAVTAMKAACALMDQGLDAFEEEQHLLTERARSCIQSVTVQDWAKFVLGEVPLVKGRSLEPTTKDLYEGCLSRHVYPVIGDVPLSRLDWTHVQRVTRRMSTLTWRAQRNVKCALGRCLDAALERDMVTKNYAALIPIVKPAELVDDDEVDIFDQAFVSRADRVKLLKALQVKRHWLFGVLFYGAMTGQRPAEIAGLRWEDIDFANLLVRPRKQYKRLRGKGLVLKRLKTRKSRQAIPLPAALAKLLLTVDRPDEFVFHNSRGRHIDPNDIAGEFRKIADAIGIKNVDGTQATFSSSCRRAFATDAGEIGLAPEVGAELLRHSADVHVGHYRKDHRLEGERLEPLREAADLISGKLMEELSKTG